MYLLFLIIPEIKLLCQETRIEPAKEDRWKNSGQENCQIFRNNREKVATKHFPLVNAIISNAQEEPEIEKSFKL
jgi:hypothetical protein